LNSKKKRIFFRVDADHGNCHGLGHLTRILKIYKFLKNKYSSKFNFFFITKKNTLGKKLIDKITNEKIYYSNKTLKNIYFNTDDKIIIDTLGAETSFLSLLNKHNVKKIVSLEEIKSNFFKKGIIINGIFFTKKKIKTQNDNINKYQNINYLILDSKFQYKKKTKLNKKILITSGGADKKNFLYKISKIILNKFGNKFSLYVVLGKGVKYNNNIFKLQNKPNLFFLRNVKNMKKCFDMCSFCITSGGNVMFESIAAGRPTFVSQTYGNQRYAIKYFKNKKLIFDIGTIKKIDKNYFYKNINYLSENKIKLDLIFKKNSKFIDGKGFIRVMRIMEKYIKE